MKKSKQVEVKFSTEELEKVKRKADSVGMKISTFIRFVSLSAKIEVSS